MVIQRISKWWQLRAPLKKLNGLKASAGWFETANYPTGVPVAYVASIHEYGAPSAGIPARPFIRPAIATYGQEWLDMMLEGAKSVIHGEATPEGVMEAVASRAAGHIGAKIAAVSAPPLKPATIKRKGGATKPLVHTGQMIDAVTFRVGANA